jgi:hypothetical protein
LPDVKNQRTLCRRNNANNPTIELSRAAPARETMLAGAGRMDGTAAAGRPYRRGRTMLRNNFIRAAALLALLIPALGCGSNNRCCPTRPVPPTGGCCPAPGPGPGALPPPPPVAGGGF